MTIASNVSFATMDARFPVTDDALPDTGDSPSGIAVDDTSLIWQDLAGAVHRAPK